MEASAPVAPHIEPEPPEWQPRAIWVGGRLLCGAISFFFASFLFAFFYLKALDVNHNWKIGSVVPDGGIGVSIAALFLLSAVIYRLAARRPSGDSMAAGIIAVVIGLAAVVLQFIEYTSLDFGAAQRRLRGGVLRLDGDVRDRRADGPVLDRDPGRELVAGAARGPMREIEVPTE